MHDAHLSAAPSRVVNIGNSDKTCLLDCNDAIEAVIGRKTIRNYVSNYSLEQVAACVLL